MGSEKYLQTIAKKYKEELFSNIIPFWERYSPDYKCGGFFTCLGRKGNIFDTDKFIWLQARQVWMFATLFNNVEKKHEWLNMALLGAKFMKKYGCDPHGNWYFSLNREGKPLVQPYNIFSDCFAAMAFGQLFKATGNEEYGNLAKNTFTNILRRYDNPKGIYSKSFPGTRPLKGLALPMILSNLSLEMEHLLDIKDVNRITDNCIHEVMNVFYDDEKGLILENVNPDGSFSDSFEGRLLIPGHAIETMWFMMDLSERNNNTDLADKAVEILLRTLSHSWDDKYGGIFYFMDYKGHPVQQLEWDQKLWWVHMETLIALIKGYMLTGNTECIKWFRKIDKYTWSHFPDSIHGEWFGYLNRRGQVLLPLKGGKWKGCFHIPRGLYQVWNTIIKMQ